MFGLRIALGRARAQWLFRAFPLPLQCLLFLLGSGGFDLCSLAGAELRRSCAGSSVVMDSVGFVLFCSVLPAPLVPHGTEDIHGLHEITQLPQNQARTLTQICSDTRAYGLCITSGCFNYPEHQIIDEMSPRK